MAKLNAATWFFLSVFLLLIVPAGATDLWSTSYDSPEMVVSSLTESYSRLY